MASQNFFEREGIADPHLMDLRLHRKHRLKSGLYTVLGREGGNFSGEEIPPVGDTEARNFSGAVMEVWEGKLNKGGTTIDIPRQMSLKGKPVSGSTQLQGKGESGDWTWDTVYFSNYRWPYNLPAGVDVQTMRDEMVSAASDGERLLGDLSVEYMIGDYNFTLLTGRSSNLSTLRSIPGAHNITTLVPHSPGNIMVAGFGMIETTSDALPGTEEFESKFKAAANVCSQNNIAFSSSDFLRLSMQARRKGIMPIYDDGSDKLHACVIKDSLYFHLFENDPKFREVVLSGFQGKYMESPIVKASRVVYGGCAVFVDTGLFGIRTDESGNIIEDPGSAVGMPYYGPAGGWISEKGTDEGLDQNDLCCSLILGPMALNKVYGRTRSEYTVEEWDHGYKREMGLALNCGVTRGEWRDAENRYGNGENAWFQDTGMLMHVSKVPYDLTHTAA